MLKSFFILLTLMIIYHKCAADYQIPEAKFKLLHPQGFKVSIPDETGIQLFAFHGSLNKELDYPGNGQVSQDIISKTNGRWTYENKNLKIHAGDVMHYWLFVIKNGRGYRLNGGRYKFSVGDLNKKHKKADFTYKKYKRDLHHMFNQPYPAARANNFGYHNPEDSFNPQPFEMRHHRHPFHGPFNHDQFNGYNHHHHHHHHRGQHFNRDFHHSHGHGHGNCNNHNDFDSNESGKEVVSNESDECKCDLDSSKECICPQLTTTTTTITTTAKSPIIIKNPATTTTTNCDGDCEVVPSTTTEMPTTFPKLDIRFGN